MYEGISVRVPSCFVEAYVLVQRADISASAGDSVLPFYPNVISAKYENSYVLRCTYMYRRRHRRQADTPDTSDEVSARESEAWAVSAGKV